MPTLHFRIGGRDHEFVQVEVAGDRGDGWIPAFVTIRAGGFAAEYRCDLDGAAFPRFASELHELQRTLEGVATFTSHEEQIELSLAGDGLGHIKVTGAAMDVAGTGNALTFHLEVDQTQLPRLVREVEAISAAHPGRVA